MLRALTTVDQTLGATRPGWLWLGEGAVVLLGVHLAADRLDDLLVAALHALSLGGPDQAPTIASISVLLEFLVALRVALVLVGSAGAPPPTWKTYKERISVEAVVRPLFWVPTAAAGCWVIGMAIEDGLTPWVGSAAGYWLGVVIAGLAAWRLGWSGLRKVVGGLFPPKHRWTGAAWAPLLLVTAGLSAWYGLPIWGWR